MHENSRSRRLLRPGGTTRPEARDLVTQPGRAARHARAALVARVTGKCVRYTAAVDVRCPQPVSLGFEPACERIEIGARRTPVRTSLQEFGDRGVFADFLGAGIGELPGHATDEAVVH